MSMLKKLIKGDIFIIPNGACKGVEYRDNPINKKRLETIFQFLKDEKSFDEEIFIEVWSTTPGDPNSNWVDGGFDNGDEEKLSSNWPVVDGVGDKRMLKLFPYSLLKDKKEGDIIKFSFEDVEFELTCNQLDYRYHKYGKFEEILERVSYVELFL